jgi:hypothetical protein
MRLKQSKLPYVHHVHHLPKFQINRALILVTNTLKIEHNIRYFETLDDLEKPKNAAMVDMYRNKGKNSSGRITLLGRHIVRDIVYARICRIRVI